MCIRDRPFTESRLDVHETSSFICWNGEAWTLAGRLIQGNDTEHIYRVLSHVSSLHISSDPQHHARAISGALASFAGPYAFAYFDASTKRIFFGRDLLGRRSLLLRRTEDDDLLVCSVSDETSEQWEEIEADGIYYVDLLSEKCGTAFSIDKVRYCLREDSVTDTTTVCFSCRCDGNYSLTF